MRQVTIHAAKTNLSKLIEAALGGEEIIIARGSKPVVRGKPGTGPDFFEPMAATDFNLWEDGR